MRALTRGLLAEAQAIMYACANGQFGGCGFQPIGEEDAAQPPPTPQVNPCWSSNSRLGPRAGRAQQQLGRTRLNMCVRMLKTPDGSRLILDVLQQNVSSSGLDSQIWLRNERYRTF